MDNHHRKVEPMSNPDNNFVELPEGGDPELKKNTSIMDKSAVDTLHTHVETLVASYDPNKGKESASEFTTKEEMGYFDLI